MTFSAPPFHYERYGQEDQAHADGFAHRHGFAQDDDAQADGCDGLEGSEKGGLGAADALDGARGEDERDDGGEEAEAQAVEPHAEGVGHHQGYATGDADHVDGEAEEQHVEGDGHGGDGADARLVEADQIDGIGERGGHHQQEAYEERVADGSIRTLVALAEQGYARRGQCEAAHHQPGEPLVEAEGHDYGHHDGVAEEQCGGNAHGHVVVAHEEQDRRGRHQQAHQDELGQGVALDAECLPDASVFFAYALEQNDGPHQKQCQQIAQQQHRVGVHAVGIERLGKDWIGAIGSSCQSRIEITFYFHLLLSFSGRKDNAFFCD